MDRLVHWSCCPLSAEASSIGRALSQSLRIMPPVIVTSTAPFAHAHTHTHTHTHTLCSAKVVEGCVGARGAPNAASRAAPELSDCTHTVRTICHHGHTHW